MPLPTRDEIEDAFVRYTTAHPTLHGLYYFDEPRHSHNRNECLEIIESCLIIGGPVTDLVSAAKWVAMARRLVALEDKVASWQ
jgi:hypothetical protein